MANPEHLGRLNQSVEGWNRWKAENRGATVDLSKAELTGKDLAGVDLYHANLSGADLGDVNFTGADLRGASLEGANLHGARLGGTLLWNANFRGANLHRADLGGTNLQDVSFAGANLFGANLRETNLRGADLAGVTGGFRTEQLAGADLTGAKLPAQLETLYDKLENVKNISESARKIFLAVLAACLYSWLTIATTTDVNLVTNHASSPLPIIQTTIPIVGFYIVAPLLVLCIYFYFHFYLQKLWEELGSLPAIFPDGRPLHAKVDPWLLNDLVRSHLLELNVNRPFLSYLQLWISVLLAWWVVPITMLLFWGRYLKRHEPRGTTFHVLLLIISLIAAVCLYRLAVDTLRGAERKPFRWSKEVGSLSWKKASLRRRLTIALAALGALTSVLIGGYILLMAVGGLFWLAVAIVRLCRPTAEGLRGTERKPLTALTKTVAFAIAGAVMFSLISREATWGTPDSFGPSVMARIGYSPFANLTSAEVSQKKSTWKTEEHKDPDSVVGAQLSGANLRYATAISAFFAGADLSSADLSSADLANANLSGATLSGAKLGGANFAQADLTSTILADTDLVHAELNDANLESADLTNANLNGAELIGAHLDSAYLNNADLTGANLIGAHLHLARLTGAHLNLAKLRRADLRDTDLRRTDLCRAELYGADLRGANLDGADLRGADLSAANLVGINLEARDLNGVELYEANLGDANLRYAHLRADLHGADLRGAHLDGADLRGAHLDHADLSGAHLDGADLNGADLHFAGLTFTDLRGAENLTPEAVKFAYDYDKAFYYKEMLERLGLPSDHNKTVAEEQKREKELQQKQDTIQSAAVPTSPNQ